MDYIAEAIMEIGIDRNRVEFKVAAAPAAAAIFPSIDRNRVEFKALAANTVAWFPSTYR